MSRNLMSRASIASASVGSALGVALVATVANLIWVQLGVLGAEPTRRAALVVSAGFAVYAVLGLAIALTVGFLRRRASTRDPGSHGGSGG